MKTYTSLYTGALTLEQLEEVVAIVRQQQTTDRMTSTIVQLDGERGSYGLAFDEDGNMALVGMGMGQWVQD